MQTEKNHLAVTISSVRSLTFLLHSDFYKKKNWLIDILISAINFYLFYVFFFAILFFSFFNLFVT